MNSRASMIPLNQCRKAQNCGIKTFILCRENSKLPSDCQREHYIKDKIFQVPSALDSTCRSTMRWHPSDLEHPLLQVFYHWDSVPQTFLHKRTIVHKDSTASFSTPKHWSNLNVRHHGNNKIKCTSTQCYTRTHWKELRAKYSVSFFSIYSVLIFYHSLIHWLLSAYFVPTAVPGWEIQQ